MDHIGEFGDCGSRPLAAVVHHGTQLRIQLTYLLYWVLILLFLVYKKSGLSTHPLEIVFTGTQKICSLARFGQVLAQLHFSWAFMVHQHFGGPLVLSLQQIGFSELLTQNLFAQFVFTS